MTVLIMKWVFLCLLVAFTGYTIYCSKTENFWKACRGVFAFKWGRQVTIDLYLGLFLFTFFMHDSCRLDGDLANTFDDHLMVVMPDIHA